MSDTNCKNCGNEIKIQIFKGEDWCSDNCRKAIQDLLKAPYDPIGQKVATSEVVSFQQAVIEAMVDGLPMVVEEQRRSDKKGRTW